MYQQTVNIFDSDSGRIGGFKFNHAPLLTVFPGMADMMGMDAFVVVVVGGFGSVTGAFVVALFLGELNAYSIQFIPRVAPVLMFAFMAIVLSFKPMGLFGERE